MIRYCTIDDLISAFGEDAIKRLANRAGTSSAAINEQSVNQAIDKASAEISMYLAGRNLFTTEQVPAGLKMIVCDIARYYLHINPRIDSPEGEQYKMRIAQLKDIASGRISFGNDDSGNAVEPETTIQFIAANPMFKHKKGGLW